MCPRDGRAVLKTGFRSIQPPLFLAHSCFCFRYRIAALRFVVLPSSFFFAPLLCFFVFVSGTRLERGRTGGRDGGRDGGRASRGGARQAQGRLQVVQREGGGEGDETHVTVNGCTFF